METASRQNRDSTGDKRLFCSDARGGQDPRGRHDQRCANTRAWAAITDTSFLRRATEGLLGEDAICMKLEGWFTIAGTIYRRAPARNLSDRWVPGRADSNRERPGLVIYFVVNPVDSSESPIQIAISSHDPLAEARNQDDRLGHLYGIAPSKVVRRTSWMQGSYTQKARIGDGALSTQPLQNLCRSPSCEAWRKRGGGRTSLAT